MAYDPGYGAPQRSYTGQPGPRPGPRGPAQSAPQQYNDYQDGYAMDGYNDGYGQGYGEQYEDPGYRRGPPPRDPYGPGGGRGGPGPGRGGGRPGPYAAHSEPNVKYQQQPQGRGPSYEYEHQMADQMSGMDLNGRMPPGRPSVDSQRSQGGYGQAPMNQGRAPPQRAYTGQSYPEPQRGPPHGQAPGGYGDYNEVSAPQRMPSRNEFGPPGRSMTMPVNDMPGASRMPPQRMGTMSYNVSAGRDMAPPPRPSTAAGSRAPPQRGYAPSMAPHDEHAGGYDNGQGYRHNSRASFDDVYDMYNDGSLQGGYGQDMGQSMYDAPMPTSADQQQQHQYQQMGPRQTPTLNHAKSQPNLRQPQAAVFEMAGEVPSMPPLPQIKPYQPGAEQELHGAEGPGYMDGIPRGPNAPPAAMNGPRPGLPGHPRSAMSAVGAGPDALPSHPAPVRAGLMGNPSMVNPNGKPAPVRNYGSQSQPGLVQAQQQQQYQQQQQPMQSIPQQQASPASIQGRAPPPKPKDPPVTPQELEHLRMVIKNNPSDQESALRLAKRLVEASNVLVPNLPNPKDRSRARDRYLVDAHKILKKLSNVQNVDAMFFMADCLGKGQFSAEPDSKEAFTLYQSAAKLGHAAAAYRTAVCCEIGHEDGGGTRKDPLKAIQWYKRAATLGDPPAMYKVGMILLKGLLGQPKNPREAVGWLKRAAERADGENPHALHELGLLYESAQPNDVIIRDEAYAFSLFQQAADLGYKFSQFRLACAYEYGLMGCPIDPRLSIMWYSRAATQEEHQSELALSGWYLTGSEGVLGQSDAEAYLWARKAAVAGLAKAEYAMGYFTEVGIGIQPNLEDAKRWYWRAAGKYTRAQFLL
jgi:TPR repeat protein